MRNIVNNFCETFGIDENQSRTTDEHHQLNVLKNARIETNCTKLSHVFSEHDVTFEGLQYLHKEGSSNGCGRQFFTGQRNWADKV